MLSNRTANLVRLFFKLPWKQQKVLLQGLWKYVKTNHKGKLYTLLCVVVYALYKAYRRYIQPLKDLRGKVVVITGGAQGLGKNMATRLSNLGCKIILWDIKPEVKETAKALGPNACAYICDLSQREEVYRVSELTLKEHVKVDVLINNAGIVSGGFLTDIPDHMIELTFNVNVLSHFWAIKALLPQMIKRKTGHIVTVASLASVTGVPKLSDYCASKHAAKGLDESLRMELKQRDLYKYIKTTCICPYYINTGMFDGLKQGKIPYVSDMLEEDYVSKKIIHAIRTNEPLLMIPRVMSRLKPLSDLLFSTGVNDYLMKALGFSDCMDDFKARY